MILSRTCILFLLMLLASSCQTNVEKQISNRIRDRSLHLMLRDETLMFEGIPKEIAAFQDLKHLTITGTKGLTIYPPFSAIDQHEYRKVLKEVTELPTELLELRNLEVLNLQYIGLKTLPNDIDRLVKLKVLDLSFNPISIKDEINKLERLKNLEKLIIYGTRFNENEMVSWAANMGIELLYSPNELLKKHNSITERPF